MTQETVNAIHTSIGKLLPIVQQLHKVWDRPLIGLSEVLIQNLSHNAYGSNNYSLSKDIDSIWNIHKSIAMLKDNSFNDPFMDWLWLEVDCIVMGYYMSEE